MKIGMRRLHLFILLFVTCSLLFHAPVPEPEQTKKEKSKRQRR